MKCLYLAALPFCAVLTSALYADQPLRRPVVIHESVAIPDPGPNYFNADFARLERVRQWQAELAARELEIQRAQTAWLPVTRDEPIAENVVRDRPTYSNALFAVARPYAFVPEPYYEMPNADRRSFAYQWSPYVFTSAVAPAPAPVAAYGAYGQPAYYAGSYPGGPAEAAVQPVTPGPGPAVVNRDAIGPVRTATVIEENVELR
jgi:hypothetical protein